MTTPTPQSFDSHGEPCSEQASSPLKNILIATDFSANADHAFCYGVELARRHRARITLAHACDIRHLHDISLKTRDALQRDLIRYEEEARTLGVPASSCLRTGRPWECIVEIARANAADLILAGTRGQTDWPHIHLGSTIDRVLRHAGCPVLCVPPSEAALGDAMRTVLIACDFSSAGTQAIKTLRSLIPAEAGPLRCILVHAFHVPVEYTMGVAAVIMNEHYGDIQEDSRRRLDALAAPLRADGHEVTIITREGYPVSVIEEVAREEEVGMIVLGTHGRSGLQHVLLGSVAERVLHRAMWPVLVVRNPDDADANPPDTPGSISRQHVR
ncbi:MAG: universal stress protein [Phycisphaerales bacterium]|nr:universal stress protein [Phycisphaerales bacterium]